MYAVGLILNGAQAIAQARKHTPLGAGDLVLYSTSQPYEAAVNAPARHSRSGRRPASPRRTPAAAQPAERLPAPRLPEREGTGLLPAGFLTRLTAAGHGACRPADRHRLGGVLTDLITAYLARHPDAEDRAPAKPAGTCSTWRYSTSSGRICAPPASRLPRSPPLTTSCCLPCTVSSRTTARGSRSPPTPAARGWTGPGATWPTSRRPPVRSMPSPPAGASHTRPHARVHPRLPHRVRHHPAGYRHARLPARPSASAGKPVALPLRGRH
jgi:hypothetical protein